MAYSQASGNVRVTGRRVVATIIDGIIFGIVSSILSAIFHTKRTGSGFSYTSLSTGGGIVLFILVILYYVILEGTLGRTVGKMATGIRVVREDGSTPPGAGAALIRTLLRIVDGLFGYLVGFIIVLASDRRRRLGDMAARTQVVRA